LSLSIRELEEGKGAQKVDYSQYEKKEESTGFQLGEMIGDQLKKLR
jgi:small subunit ribosomal protein S1